MPAPLDVDREAVKAHAITHGLRAAAMAFGLPVGTVGAWSMRDPNGPWCPRSLEKIPASVQIQRPPTVTPRANSANSASDAAKKSLSALGEKSRLSLAKAIHKGAKHASKLQGEDILAKAPQIKALADTGDKLHQWSASPSAPTLRLELIASSPDAPPPLEALDVESVVSREGMRPEGEQH